MNNYSIILSGFKVRLSFEVISFKVGLVISCCDVLLFFILKVKVICPCFSIWCTENRLNTTCLFSQVGTLS